MNQESNPAAEGPADRGGRSAARATKESNPAAEGPADPAPAAAESPRVGIFRRVAVERYSQPLTRDHPSLLPAWPGWLTASAVAAALAAGLLLLAA
jgi:hypothetical protein